MSGRSRFDERRGASAISELVIAAPMRVESVLVGSASRRANVHKTGMGPKRAKAAALALERKPGAALLVLGFCGGLDEHSRPGEVIVAERVTAGADEGHAETPVACADPHDLAAALRVRGIPVRIGEIVSVSKLALGERRAELLAGGALAVDMESVWLAAGAAERPFAVVRVVLDSPSHELLRPQALAGALRAARTLRRVTGILRDWTPAAAGRPPTGASFSRTGQGNKV
jgi:4-hydroxy-3-methylbut-2-en-1-yl diphosphate reductase